MRYLKVEGSLLDVFGDAVRDTDGMGIMFFPLYQFICEGQSISLGTIVDETKAQKYFNYAGVTILETITDFNSEIDNAFIPQYNIYNEGLMNANLNQKVTDGTIDLNEMLPEWTPQQESEWLYNQGVSGISKSEKPPYLSE